MNTLILIAIVLFLSLAGISIFMLVNKPKKDGDPKDPPGDACVAGETYSDTGKAPCNDCSTCTEGTVVDQPCTATTDKTCVLCQTTCPDGQVVDQPCTATTATTCRQCSTCPDGKVVDQPCTATTATTCKPCSTCPDGQVVDQPCTATTDTTCRQCSTCPAGQVVDQPCTATTATTCRQCPTCPAGQVVDQHCTATTATTCKQCSTCPDGQVVDQPCTATTDTTCMAAMCEFALDGTTIRNWNNSCGYIKFKGCPHFCGANNYDIDSKRCKEFNDHTNKYLEYSQKCCNKYSADSDSENYHPQTNCKGALSPVPPVLSSD
jgi:hypothetical protein